MRVMAQVAMVMNLDKCIGCHTCSVTCKQTWTNREGVEYVWFNNVETKPGIGYPKRYEDQERWHGGWVLDRHGRLRLRSGGRTRRLLSLFANPDLPTLDDYYEPASYDYDTLITAPAGAHTPVARPKSALTGEDMAITWGPNWEDDLGGAPEHAPADPNLAGLTERVRFEFERTFMFHLPRICEHCLNPACVSACPSGAMYKRAEDGVVLVDQDRCRGWRMCVSGCPYKKVYVNHRTGKAEKCTFCFPRLEAGQPTVCAETCPGRLRYLGLVLYDADAVLAAASTPDPADLLEAQRNVFLDPEDPEVRSAALSVGIPEDWLDAARRSPVYKLICRYRIALPLHPEYRTMPMVWYVPPLSPVLDVVSERGGDSADPDDVFHAIRDLRIPVEYLASLLSAGDSEVVAGVLMKLAAMRGYMRARSLDGSVAEDLLAATGMSEVDMEEMYRLLAVAKYQDRYVIPAAHQETAAALSSQNMGCGLDVDGGPGMGGGDFPLTGVRADGRIGLPLFVRNEGRTS
ncbi:respiratory nitrate reductase beta subunit [Streptoalloteichus tenebrarius]|uniref:Respiratory nitrate reductase beta subunit n=1 Tax=Streptoalloteichus tenebrarius (strain ATCC 17920 / DSM 40477 / JCM 4838 / CBS 697.72 / NBRC 16177 / NCIMB 11028 / NRRL B-12390 / A12253. 1 / ISP 5477) TaxID=1933 RepID=A0ABT1HRT5_STRSD|nr:nitrate reductase subunit beta [Streptoalloteichus tenebrarius]MCP2258229.1 respiratory nitrate reductase beta subunit [Streptoalloteichus tenebrarius]BFF04541.1 nitrate reductase subunit beta [Streptoalloteichus tenebrarius]